MKWTDNPYAQYSTGSLNRLLAPHGSQRWILYLWLAHILICCISLILSEHPLRVDINSDIFYYCIVFTALWSADEKYKSD